MDVTAAAELLIELGGLSSSLRIWRIVPGVVLVRIEGPDVGQYGDVALLTIEQELISRPIELFIDAGGSKGASMEVSNAWAQWFSGHRGQLRTIHMLTGSRFTRLTADFVRQYAELESFMFIYSDVAAFYARLRQVSR